MNTSNINLKCDGTLPKGKFLECTEHTTIFSYCSKCDMLLCSNCIIIIFLIIKSFIALRITLCL